MTGRAQARASARRKAIPRLETRAAARARTAFVIAALLVGCGTTGTVGAGVEVGAQAGGVRSGWVQEGRASYYSHAFDGHRTASGERYDPHLLTAAHPTLPLGTWLRVTRPGGASVEVRVNDRCGCGGGRIIDLSDAAARKLGMLRAGIVHVRLEVIRRS
jgi:rare lipoprotein A